MGKLTKSDHVRLDELGAELNILKLGAPSAIRSVLAEFRVLAELESMLCMSPVERTTGWGLERFECVNFANDTKFRQLSVAFLERAPRRFGWFDPIRPEPAQRNVVLDLDDLVTREELERSPGYAEVLAPLRLQGTHQIRALICDGASLLGWFGAFHPERADERQQELMIAMIPAMRRRLSIERQLDAAAMTAAALETTLEQLGVPAFIVSATGRVFDANQVGKTLLEARRAEVTTALRDALAQRPSQIQFEVTRFRQHGAEDHWLAILRVRAVDVRVVRAISGAVSRFQLTVRQREVLELLLRGETNANIATALAITERAVEQHVSAMLDRAEVDNRSALIALVLLG
ncbi:MAG: LuxR family transcriptional regulator [Myxococcales bacterium]|nr:LuxR family transcriptional regulator [Myxococcales bacterium]